MKSISFHAHQDSAHGKQDSFVGRPAAGAVRERLAAIVDPLGRIHLDKSHPSTQSVQDAARGLALGVCETQLQQPTAAAPFLPVLNGGISRSNG